MTATKAKKCLYVYVRQYRGKKMFVPVRTTIQRQKNVAQVRTTGTETKKCLYEYVRQVLRLKKHDDTFLAIPS